MRHVGGGGSIWGSHAEKRFWGILFFAGSPAIKSGRAFDAWNKEHQDNCRVILDRQHKVGRRREAFLNVGCERMPSRGAANQRGGGRALKYCHALRVTAQPRWPLLVGPNTTALDVFGR